MFGIFAKMGRLFTVSMSLIMYLYFLRVLLADFKICEIFQ